MLRTLRILTVATVMLAGLTVASRADTYPDRPIKVVVPFPAGGATDVLARLTLEKAAGTLGQSFIIENLAGAGGNVGTANAVRAEPDGYRLLLSGVGPLAVNKTLSKNLPYDPERDLEPISLVATMPNIVVVSNSMPVKSLAELVAYLKERPGKINYSSIGLGSSQHLAGVVFEQVTGTKITHVPYRAAPQLAIDLVTGVVPLSFQLIPNILGQLKAREMRPLAVMAVKRSAIEPDVPTTVELGLPKLVSTAWFGLLAPRGTPRPIIEKLNAAVVAAINDPVVNARLIEIGTEPAPSTPEQFGKLIADEVARWRDVVTTAGLTME